MAHRFFTQRLILPALTVLFCSSFHLQAQAINLDIRSSSDNTLDFSLVLSNKITELADGQAIAQTTAKTRVRRVGITSTDIPQHGIRFGLQLGYAYIHQDDIAATRGMPLNGYYTGLGFQLPVFVSTRLNAFFVGNYTWQSVKGVATLQSVSLEWNEINAGLLATLKLARFNLMAGILYSFIDATQTATGDIRETLFMESDNNKMSQLGLDYVVAEGEFVGVHLFNGSARGVELQFRKLFH